MTSALRLTTCSAAIAIAMTGIAAQPVSKPNDEAERAERMQYRADTVAGRYRDTMIAPRVRPEAGDIVGDLVEEALDPNDAEIDGEHMLAAALAEDRSDLDRIDERGYIRLAIAPDPLMIAYDGRRAIGVAMDLATELEKFLAERSEVDGPPPVVVPVPRPREVVAEAVAEGRSDFTPLYTDNGHDEGLTFTVPLLSDVNHIPVLGPEAPDIDTIDALTEVPLYVSDGSRYADSLERLNDERTAAGKQPFDVRYVDSRLDDYDLMEMAEVGLIPGTVMASHKAEFWGDIYTSVEVHQDLELTEDGRIAWAVRSENPELLAALNDFADEVKQGTLVGNVVLKKYLGSTDWIENIGAEEAAAKIAHVQPVIEEYSERYEFEPDLVLAQAYQESGLDQAKVSHAGAVGVMQVMPATASDPVVGIPNVKDLESNVHAGVKYLRWLRDTYYSEPEIAPLDRTLLSFAAYNAGPGGVQRARAKAREMDLDPNVWFENVEIAITRAVSREPAVYVRNIFKYFVAHRLMRELEAEHEAALEVVDQVRIEVEDLPAEERIEALEAASIVVEGGEGEPGFGGERQAVERRPDAEAKDAGRPRLVAPRSEGSDGPRRMRAPQNP